MPQPRIETVSTQEYERLEQAVKLSGIDKANYAREILLERINNRPHVRSLGDLDAVLERFAQLFAEAVTRLQKAERANSESADRHQD